MIYNIPLQRINTRYDSLKNTRKVSALFQLKENEISQYDENITNTEHMCYAY